VEATQRSKLRQERQAKDWQRTSQGLATSPKKKGRFDQKSPDGHTGELHVLPAVTRYFLARGRSFKIMIEDLLKHRQDSQNERSPLILRAQVQRLRHIAHKRMVYIRATYCLFKNTVSETEKDNIALVKLHMHREDSQNERPPLILRAQVQRLRHIAHKRMGYTRATYRLFKNTVSETEKDNIALVKLHMKMCVKHYHSLIPQLDLIATQWGINIAKTAEEGSHSEPKTGPSGGRGGHAEVKGLATSPKKGEIYLIGGAHHNASRRRLLLAGGVCVDWGCTSQYITAATAFGRRGLRWVSFPFSLLFS
jgi:hypothetical protein